MCPLTLGLASCPVRVITTFFAVLPCCIPSLLTPIFALTKPTLSCLFFFLSFFTITFVLSFHLFFLIQCYLSSAFFSFPSVPLISFYCWIHCLTPSHFPSSNPVFFSSSPAIVNDQPIPSRLTCPLCLYFQDAFVVCSSSHSSSSSGNSSREEPVIPAYHCF